MPQDPDLYGKRTAKRKKTELGLSDTLDFTAHMQSLIKAKPSGASSKSSAKRSGASQQSLSAPASKRSKTAETGKDTNHGGASRSKAAWAKRPVQGTADTELSAQEREQIRRNMAIKAKRYAQMQRGDYIPREGELPSLVDFDRKWADKRRDGEASESEHTSDSEDESEDDSGGDSASKEMVEYVDEFGRTRTVSKARRERDLRREERAARTAQELDDMRARPAPPPDASRLLYGDVIQTQAIEATVDRPPERGDRGERGEDGEGVAPTHYRAQDDVRTRGAAFYAFATDDEKARAEQMQALADERAKTEAARAARSAQLDARKQEMAARRAALAERKAKKQADSFLDGLEKNLFTEEAVDGQ
ncbi:hypothetical protein SEPCBS119000_001089 [Sporothrix epigloea]|uniref:Uncharacterized protein n=1 Tax=Sporothrix epigloea TaxID=1892477 RepID=A0ABP0DBZ3_9PEZI